MENLYIENLYIPTSEKDGGLHQKKQNGSLLQEREEYKKIHDREFFDVYRQGTIADGFVCMCQKQRIYIDENWQFVYFIDYVYALDNIRGHCFGNLTPSYEILLSHGLSELKYADSDTPFCDDYNKIIGGLEVITLRIIEKIKRTNTKRASDKIKWFENLLVKPAEHFSEALQRILFTNQIMWQTNHYLTGLGNLDSLLYPYYENDRKAGYLDEETAKEQLSEFLQILHQYYWYKSSMLMGDTGQIIVLGSSDQEGNYRYNALTEVFLELIQTLQLPDPKLLLRVNGRTPETLLKKALLCIGTGVGSPILSNDDAVIPALIKFGVKTDDACNYAVSACWEPLIAGKSVSLNNITTLNYMRPLENLFRRERLTRLETFEEFVECYLTYLGRNLNAVKRVVTNARFQYDPVLSVFTEGCRENRKDVSWGGAKYFHAGVTSVALGNVVDALWNIKEYVYDKKKYSLIEVKQMIFTNYEGREKEREELKAKKRSFGTDQEAVIRLTQTIMDAATRFTKAYRTEYGGKIKFGLSAPVYIDAAVDMYASFDGRSYGEPFTVHISNETADSYTEILNFAAALDYGENRFNGNVIDLMVSPDFIQKNLEKFVTLIKVGIKKGIFQLQMNVVSSELLINARKNPEAFPNLIVRVWGFSALFIDLPDEYKDMLIRRALKNEGKEGKI